MIAAVVIDSWKLAIFKRHLDAGGFVYTEHPGITANTLTLRVKCDYVHKLQPTVEAAHRECAEVRRAFDTFVDKEYARLIPCPDCGAGLHGLHICGSPPVARDAQGDVVVLDD